MATSDIEICNRALQTYLRAGRITSMNEATPAAEQCALHYRPAVRSLLNRHSWSWATERRALALLVNDRETEWGFRYARPAGAIRIRWVNDANAAQVLARSGRWHDARRMTTSDSIYSDVPGAVAEYTVDREDPTLYPPAFDDALAATLAANIAVAITDDVKKAQFAEQKAAELIDLAIVLDINENMPPQPVNVPEWLRARGGTADYAPPMADRANGSWPETP